jgi:hypothetical protein
MGAVAFAESSDEGTTWPNFRQQLHEGIAGALGITVEEYDQAIDEEQEQVVGAALADGWLTEEQAEQWRSRMDQVPEGGTRGMGRGFPGHLGGKAGFGESLIGVAADQMGLSRTELLTKLQDGQSIADVAEELGLDTESILAAYLADVSEHLDEAVEEGRMTEKQAEAMLSDAEDRAINRLENIFDDGMLRGFGGRGHGGRGSGLSGPDMF